MKVLISSLDNIEYSESIEMTDLSHHQGKFSMRCVMGDDWLQRLNSPFDFLPSLVRSEGNLMFVVFELENQA